MLFIAGCSSSVPSAPGTGVGIFVANVEVTNSSSTCAWVTVYFSTFYKPWIIPNQPYNRPRFVYPHQFFTFKELPFEQVLPVPIPGEIKVRAEFMKQADCSGGQVADTSNENKTILPDSGTAGLLARVYSTLSGDIGTSYQVSKPAQK